MGRIKFPKSLLRAFFPKRKNKKSRGGGDGFVPVVDVDVDGTGGGIAASPPRSCYADEDGDDPAPTTTRASTSYLDLEELLLQGEHGARGEWDPTPSSSSSSSSTSSASVPPVAEVSVDAAVFVVVSPTPTQTDGGGASARPTIRDEGHGDVVEVEKDPENVEEEDDGASAIPAGMTAASSGESEGRDDANREGKTRSGANEDDDDAPGRPEERISPEHEPRPDSDSPSSAWDRRPTASDILAAIATVEDAPEDDDDDKVDGKGGRESVDDVRGVAAGTYSEEGGESYHDRAVLNDEDAVVVSPSPHPRPSPVIVEEGGDRYHDRAVLNDEDVVVVQREAVDGDGIVVSPSPHPCPSPVIVDGDGGTRAAARYSFSHRGEEARSRAIARQRRILSRAGDRLDAISETSLAGIEEAEAEIAATAEATEARSVATTSEYGSVRSSVTHSRRIVDEDGTERGGISSIVFYESPTMMRNAPPMGQGGEVRAVEDAMQAREWGGAAVVTPTASANDNADGEDKVRGRSFDDGLVVGVPASGEKFDNDRNSDNILDMQFFVLMLCPTSRIFELVDIASSSADEGSCATIISSQSTVDDVLNAITRRCTDARLLTKKYVGFVRACDRTEFVDPKMNAFRPSSSSFSTNCKHESEHGRGKFEAIDFIRENDVLVAILEGYSGHQMAKISKPILRNSKFREMVRRRSSKVNDYGPNRTGVSDAGGRSRCHENGDRGKSDGDDNKSTRSSGNNSARSSQSRRRPSKQGGAGSKRVVTVDDLVGNKMDDDGLLIDSDISVGRSWSKRRKNKVLSSKKAAASAASSKGAPSSPKTNDFRHSSLCQKLEQLSKKLHDVDDEIVHDDPISSSAIATDRHHDVGEEHSEDVVFNKSTTTPQYDMSICNTSFKMTPKMVAYELAMNIEEIFADHNVEIVAVDADDEGSDSDVENDDDTFFSSRSMRSNALSARALGRKFDNAFVTNGDNKAEDQGRPVVLEFIAQKKDRKMRKFDIYGEREEDDLMMQIEAMARQADAAFESRKNTHADSLTAAVIEPEMGIAETIIDGNSGLETMEDTDEEAVGIIANDIVQECLETSFDEEIDTPTPIDGLSMTESIDKKEGRGSTINKQRDAISRNFLNASTSMVSTMVATSQGRVNEVHVLQYLGVTIVCIAANFMEQTRGRGADTASPSSTAKAVFQSAMFLAFVANGQRYLAKVTKKN